mgnify:CR=1 FL=1
MRSNSSNNLNRDDTSPLGGPSTSDDISLVRGHSKEENKTRPYVGYYAMVVKLPN